MPACDPVDGDEQRGPDAIVLLGAHDGAARAISTSSLTERK
jgi:hypothetical protein